MTQRRIEASFSLSGGDEGAFELLRLEAHESLEASYSVRVELRPRDGAPAFDADTLPGKRAVVRLERDDGKPPRHFHGVVREASLRGPGHWALELVARFELLGLGRDARHFQQVSPSDVVKRVLRGAGLGDDEQKWAAGVSTDERPFVVQYGESDAAFVRRLLREEGISLAVRNTAERELAYFFDAPSALERIAGDSTLEPTEAEGTDAEDALWDLRDVRTAAPDAAMVRDYDFEHAGADLSATAQAPRGGAREMYEHHGRFRTAAAGQKAAQRVLDRHRAATRLLRGRSDCWRLEPGRYFELRGHARAAFNGEYVVTSVTHRLDVRREGAGGPTFGYRCEFVAAPKATPVRPPAPVKPAAHRGTQLAFVTCAPGEEIHTDEFGRAKVRYVWDRAGVTDDQSSAWMRVGQLALGGSMTLPRKDFEVLVSHELGSLDRPFVSGHLYNAREQPPYALPANKTRTSYQTATTQGGGGANELRFEDSAGGEEIFFNASKDMTISVEHDASWNVTNDWRQAVGSNREVRVGAKCSVEVVSNRSLDVGGSQTVTANSAYGDTVGGAMSITIGATRNVKCGGDLVEEVTGSLSRTVSALQSVTGIAGYSRQITGASQVKVGAAWLEVMGGSRSSAVTGGRTELVGALKMIRAKDMSVSAGTVYTATCAANVVKCDGARTDSATGALALTSGGGLSVKASAINISAKSRLQITAGGVSISLTSGGTVEMRAAQVDLTGVKKLGQAMHRSG